MEDGETRVDRWVGERAERRGEERRGVTPCGGKQNKKSDEDEGNNMMTTTELCK